MTDETNPEETLQNTTAPLVDATKALIEAVTTMTREDRAEARDVERLDLHRREVEQLLRIREEQHKAHLEDLAHVRVHRNTMEVVAIENAKNVARIADTLQAIAKKELETP